MIVTTLLTTSFFAAAQLPDSLWFDQAIQRDMTGDGIPEVLQLTARGTRIDSLNVRFEIASRDRVLFEAEWNTRGHFNWDRRTHSDAEVRLGTEAALESFFESRRFTEIGDFQSPMREPEDVPLAVINRQQRYASILDSLVIQGEDSPEARQAAIQGRYAPPYESPRSKATWQAMLDRRVLVFAFSPGGDSVQTIAWSPLDQRFYELMECC